MFVNEKIISAQALHRDLVVHIFSVGIKKMYSIVKELYDWLAMVDRRATKCFAKENKNVNFMKANLDGENRGI